MLYCYVLQRPELNWVHSCLTEYVKAIHQCVDTGTEVGAWPALIPFARRDDFRPRRSLREALRRYEEALRALANDERIRVLAALDAQNNIADLLEARADCEDLDALPESIRQSIRDVFETGFSLLTTFRTRDEAYQYIYDHMPSRVCPFCGCEYFSHPGGVREPLDHYLAESRFPFAAANLNNLVPMGTRCNSGFKRWADILHSSDGTRRRAINPYGGQPLSVSLVGSKPLGIEGDSTPIWVVSLNGDPVHCSTWDSVFNISERYREDVLTRELRTWINAYASWARSARVDVGSQEALVEAVERYTRHLHESGLNDRAFLKAQVFEALLVELRIPDQRISSMLRNLSRLYPR